MKVLSRLELMVPVALSVFWFVWIIVLPMIRNHREPFGNQIPGQLPQLVMLAHGVSEVPTIFDIRVSPDMQDALCAPLTREQLKIMRASKADVWNRDVHCKLISSRFKGEALSGVVQVSVRVTNKYSNDVLVCPDVQLKITVLGNGKPAIDHRWEVAAVEQIP